MTRTTHPIAAKREALGLSQRALEDKSGIDRVKISRLERGGRQYVAYADLAALGRVLEASPRELVSPGQAIVCESTDDLRDLARAAA